MAEKTCEDMQVVVLMGGLGSRLKEHTQNCPKPLLPVCEKPFFQYQLEIMKLEGFKNFVFCLGYRAEMIEEYFGDGQRFGVNIVYSYDGKHLLGTGGAVRKALPLLESHFLLMYGDSFMDIDYFEVIVRYLQSLKRGKKSLMTVMRNDNRFDKSNIICKDGEIVLYDKKQQLQEMNYIDYGVSIFSRELFEPYPLDKAFDLSEIQNALSIDGKLVGCEVEHRFYEIGTPSSYAEFVAYVERRWNTPNKAVFLDRDGVINSIVWNEETEQLDSPLKRDQFQLLPDVVTALQEIQNKGYLLFVVTNQPAAAKGKTTFAELCSINHLFVQTMQKNKVDISEVIMCPHYEKTTPHTKETFLIQSCSCRKPKSGMIQKIITKYNIDTSSSWMVGDSYTDILCGKDAKLRTAFIGKYKCDLCMMLDCNKPDKICKNLNVFTEGLPNAKE